MPRYELKPSEHSSHSVILRAVGEGHGRALLDVGCADGQVSELFVQAGWAVTGIEPDPVDAGRARDRGIEILEMTLEGALEQIDGPYDMVVLADVLEHCANPWEQLSRIVAVCRPGARLVISIPNIAHAVPRARLAFGKFEYEDRGIMDRTHLRFFTCRTAVELVVGAGLACESIEVTPTPLELVFPRLSEGHWGRRLLAVNAGIAKSVPRLLGYQFVMVCRVPGTSAT